MGDLGSWIKDNSRQFFMIMKNVKEKTITVIQVVDSLQQSILQYLSKLDILLSYNEFICNIEYCLTIVKCNNCIL